MTHHEEELKEIEFKIQAITRIINNLGQIQSFKEKKQKELIRLIARKKILENKIIEGTLLE